MKLDYFIEKQRILEINSNMPESARWPSLSALLSICDEKMPMFSESADGAGIFIGWKWNYPGQPDADQWLYHHAITSIHHDHGAARYFGFHYDGAMQAIAKGKIIAAPIFSVGKIAESAKFARILRSIGVRAYVNMPALTLVEPYERNSNNRHTWVL